jgi:hypothetical protein
MPVRNLPHRVQRAGMANCRRWVRFHSDAGLVWLLGAGHPLASLFSSLDVRRYHRVGCSQKLVGVFHWVLSSWAVDLRKHLCYHLLHQRAATAFSMGSHGLFGAGRFAYRSACLVFEFVCCHWVRLGILSSSKSISTRCGEVSGYLRAHHRILRSGYGCVSTSLSRSLSSDVAPALTLMGRHPGAK